MAQSKGTLQISRRNLCAWGGMLGASALLFGAAGTVAGCAPNKGGSQTQDTAPEAAGLDYDTVTWGGCHVNCGSRCPLQVYVKDGTVVRIGIDDEGSDDFGPGELYQMRSCVRGRTNRQRIYNDTRVQHPMRRVAGTKRGEGKYEQITWDEAITEIAQALQDVKQQYGNDAIYIQYGTGQLGGTVAKSWSPDSTMFARLMNCWGGYLRHYSDYSTGQITWELPLLNGAAFSNNEVTDLVNSKNIILWGNNPANTRMSGSAMVYLITQVREQNPDAQIVVIDPHLTDTAVGVANQWVPIRPGTDVALVAGMTHYLLTNNKLDEQYIRAHCIGFYSDAFASDITQGEPPDNSFMGYDASGSLAITQDMSYEAYLHGTGAYAGTGEKDEAWAAGICGVPEQTIRSLADLYVNGPTATVQGWGPQRHSNGGNNTRAIGLIAAITGNYGISGGGTGAREGTGGVPFKVKTAIPCFPDQNGVTTMVSFFDWFHAIEDYKSMDDRTWGIRYNDAKKPYAATPGEIKLKAPIKFIWNYASNVMAGQHADINEMLRIYNLPDTQDSGLHMVVTVDCYLTPTAMVSDIILPGTTSFEEDDISAGGSAWTGFVCCESAAIQPLFEAKPVYEICTLIADKLGVKDAFTEGKTQLDWVQWCYDQGVAAGDTNLPATFDEFRSQGLWKQTDSHTPAVPDASKLATPSGKFEVFSKQAYNLSQQWDLTDGGYYPNDGLDQITGLPIYYPNFEGYGDEAARATYPYQLIGHHTKTRTHSSYGNVDWMKSVAPQQCWINSSDANQLGIKEGDKVAVSTARGTTQLPAKVTPRIMPGVVSIPQGAWYTPASRDAGSLGDKGVVDQGGCISVLTSSRPTPLSKGNGVHSNLCKIEKA
jgi:anaerobic dimethyl sulfoxide reductase subunit A